MSIFKPALPVTTTGQLSLGQSPSKSLSILSVGVSGTLGVFLNGTFYPNAEGAIAPGEMLVFDCGVGREVGISVTSGTGIISSSAV